MENNTNLENYTNLENTTNITNTTENVIIENVSTDTTTLSTIHNDLGIICTFLIFFTLGIIVKMIFKFFKIFF